MSAIPSWLVAATAILGLLSAATAISRPEIISPFINVTYPEASPLLDANCLRCMCNDYRGAQCKISELCYGLLDGDCDLLGFNEAYWLKAGALRPAAAAPALPSSAIPATLPATAAAPATIDAAVPEATNSTDTIVTTATNNTDTNVSEAANATAIATAVISAPASGKIAVSGWVECKRDPDCSIRTVLAYLALDTKRQDCNGDGVIDCMEFAATHFFGHDHCDRQLLQGRRKNRLQICLCMGQQCSPEMKLSSSKLYSNA